MQIHPALNSTRAELKQELGWGQLSLDIQHDEGNPTLTPHSIRTGFHR